MRGLGENGRELLLKFWKNYVYIHIIRELNKNIHTLFTVIFKKEAFFFFFEKLCRAQNIISRAHDIIFI